jgi:phenylacetyl-CoA:acceptor oxidoreductase
MQSEKTATTRDVPTYCYNCVAGPDLLTVKVTDGVATGIGPNFAGEGLHPADGRPCVKAYGLIQKTYHPARILTPMKRTNPKKGMHEAPGFVPISWDEALDIVAGKVNAIRAKGALDESGMPRIAATFGQGGSPANYMGTFPAWLSVLGSVDFSFGSGQGVKCVHSEHLYGEFWHRAFTVSADTPLTKFNISVGNNNEVSGGPCATWRHADARVRGMRRIQVEPHLSITGAASAEWVPIKPKTDGAFLFALIHAMLHEHPRERLDLAFLRDSTSAVYLVGPNGFYLRDAVTEKPLIWDTVTQTAVPFDAPGAVPLLEGTVQVAGAIEIGADTERWTHGSVGADTAFAKLVAHMQPYSPEWAQGVCDVPAAKIRAIASEFLDNACIGQTIDIDGQAMPFRPVAITLGKTVNNGWGAFEAVWARTVLAVLAGALEVPGGTLGTTVRLNRPHEDRHASVKAGPDGLLVNDLNPTGKGAWKVGVGGRNAHRSLVPLVKASGAWSQSLGPTHLAWMFQHGSPENWPAASKPEIWFAYRTNPAISFWDTRAVAETMARFPFTVCFAYTPDETNHMADVLLPEATDLESTQLIRLGKTKFIEQYWEHEGAVLRQPAVAPRGDTRDFTWITNELAKRTGVYAEYIGAINRGAIGFPLAGPKGDFALDPAQEHSVDAIWDAMCKAASAEITSGAQVHDLAWFKEHGFLTRPFEHRNWYLFPTMKARGVRFELPYQERLLRTGRELANRLHEASITWWDRQLMEYQALPVWHDFPKMWEDDLVRRGLKPADFPFWLISTKSMQYYSGGNAMIQLMDEVSSNLRTHCTVVINADVAEKMGIDEGDELEVKSAIGTTRGPAMPVQGVRPDTLVIVGQFDHWATPYAKDMKAPSLNTVAPMTLELTDATGSGADVVRVAVRKIA